MGWDATLRKILTALTSIVTGIFVLDIASRTAGFVNEEITDTGSRLIMGGVLAIFWIVIAFFRRHPEWFSDYYEY